MSAENVILEIPVSKTKDVNDLVKWFEKEKVYEKKHPTIAMEKDDLPALVVLGFFVIIGMALMILEEKGKWKIKSSDSDKSVDDFRERLVKSRDENSMEKLIEKRYDINLLIIPHHGSLSQQSKVKNSLDGVFGLWKGKNKNLNKVREEQWERRK
ncbi:MAG: hypothetical protein JWP12_1670 [Bacteroidetes bacterium]|nr:hypothetical protein [Bacteroidota bacterium]